MNIKYLLVYGSVFELSGCAPGPPFSSAFPEVEWVSMGIIVLFGFLLCRKEKRSDITLPPFLIDVLNDLTHQLKEIKEKIETLEKQQNQDKQNK